MRSASAKWFSALSLTVVLAVSACSGGDSDATATTVEPAVTTSTTEPGSVPDGQLVAYQSDRGGGEGIWVRSVDSGEERKLRLGAGDAFNPDWSPDGRQLVVSRSDGSTQALHVHDLEEGTSSLLFECAEPCVGDDEPAFSPDGTRVAFIRALGPITDGLPTECGIWIGDVETKAVRQVTSHDDCTVAESFPRWSPDGARLTYWALDTANEHSAVFVVAADGTGATQLTPWEENGGDPSFSPDGGWILYSTNPLRDFSGISNLIRIHPDATGREPLTSFTDDQVRASQPRYSPDGDEIVFTHVTSKRDLAVIPAAGGEITLLTNGERHYTHPALQPTD